MNTNPQLEIYGTLGPSCCTVPILKEMFTLGMTGMRLNLSHCDLWDKSDWLNAFHTAHKELNINADLLIDMKGPELRLKKVPKELSSLTNNTTITLTQDIVPDILIQNTNENDYLLIDDGKIELQVTKVNKDSLICKVIRGGVVLQCKSIAIKGKSITGNVLNESDILNLKKAIEYGVTGIMQPFVRNKEDLIEIKRVLKEINAESLKIYAKVENLDGVKQLKELIPYCDHIVIARGDLGNATGLSKLPVVQKEIENICKEFKMPYMVVTEMLASMVDKQVPTRAEVSDIFHAVYNGASSIMLTGETASGKYPIDAMRVFVETAREALKVKKQ